MTTQLNFNLLSDSNSVFIEVATDRKSYTTVTQDKFILVGQVEVIKLWSPKSDECLNEKKAIT